MDVLDVADGGQNRGPIGSTTERTTWIVKKSMWYAPEDHFPIVNEDKEPVLHVSSDMSTLYDGVIFYDKKGNRLAYLKTQLLAMVPTWKLHTFVPNFPGQKKSDELPNEKGKVPLYRYADIKGSMTRIIKSSGVGEFTFSRYVEDLKQKKVQIWYARVKYVWEFKMDVRAVESMDVIGKFGFGTSLRYDEDAE